MFFNMIVSPRIDQPDPNRNEYIVSTGNMFHLPVEGSFFTMNGLIVIGDYEPGHKLLIQFESEDGEYVADSKMLIENWPELNSAESITIKINLANIPIPKFGFYKLVAILDGKVVAQEKFKFDQAK